MAGFWGRRKREEADAADAELARQAERALVAADERIRLTTDELHFAEAELGEGPTRDLKVALESVRHHLGEAFTLNQLNHDEVPDTAEELRTRNGRIVQLCEWAEDVLEDRTTALEPAIAAVRRAPEILERVRQDAVRLRERIPHAREVLERLNSRYSEAALRQVSQAPAEAEKLLAFAEHGADVSARRREAGEREQANLALEAATEAVRRAETLLESVDTYEIEALRAESTLAAVVEDSRGDLITARRVPQTPELQAAAESLRAALTALTPADAKADPLGELTTLREANARLDSLVQAALARAARPIPSVEQVRHVLDDADRQIAVARSVIAGHRGFIGADARTRLAEAERTRIDVTDLVSSEDTREQALALARRAGMLASEALQLAQQDIDASRPEMQGWGGGPGWGGGQRGWGGGGGMGGVGGILGGVVIGSLLGDMFDG